VQGTSLATRTSRLNDLGGDRRQSLALRLRARSGEIEQAVVNRIRASAPFDEGAEPEYLHGLRDAIRAAIEYGLLGVEKGEPGIPPVPTALLLQARVAARHAVPVGTVLRRYTLGCNQLLDFVAAEVELDGRLSSGELRQMLRELTIVFERLLEELEDEYGREPQECHSSSDGRLLSVRPHRDVVWAWIGTRAPLDRAHFYGWAPAHWPAQLSLALGEPATGPTGWRLTHEQAKEAFPFTIREQRPIVRYSEVALKAAIERDTLAASSLRQLYLTLLGSDGSSGEKLGATLRAYLNAGHNGASAAADLGMTRQTVSNHIRKIEQRLGRSLTANTADIEMALWLAEMDQHRLTGGS
jgi:PucR-like helix-turn-helix protein